MTPADLTKTVREALTNRPHSQTQPWLDAIAALDALEAEIARLTEAAQFAGMPAWERLWNEKQAAEASATKWEDEFVEADDAREAAEAERDHARDALREIAHPLLAKPETYRDIARAALGDYRTKTGKILTDADIEKLADEAERGYDVDAIRRHPHHDPTPITLHLAALVI